MKNKINARLAGMTLLWVVLAAFGNNIWAQPVVQVPATCNVVAPGSGTGVTTGFGGVVGSGGIVVMTDPYAGGAFTVNPFTATISGWSLAGDISVQGGFPPGSPLQNATGLTVSIMSLNKYVRPSEATPPSSASLARSKGRVSIGYNDTITSCGGSIQFDILKNYTDTSYLPPIIGPGCWLADSTYTYSVDQIASDNLTDGIGIDNYYWTITDTNGVNITNFYTSADQSSITLVAPNPVGGPWLLSCCFGRANPWDASIGVPNTCVYKAIGGQPIAPSISIPSCLNTGATSFTANVSPEPGYFYSWEASNISWTLTPSGTQNENLLVSTVGDEPGIITLTITNGSCIPVKFVYNIERLFVAPTSISGDTCVMAGTIHNYTLPGGALNNVTCWTLPPGWTSTDTNNAGSSINVTIPGGTSAGSYTLYASSCACSSGVISITVHVMPEVPVITSGSICVQRNAGATEVYTCSASPGATDYQWNFPSGWTCLVGCTGTSPVVLINGNTPGPVNITVTAKGTGGCNATSAPYTVNYAAVDPTAISYPCWNFGVNGSTNVTVTGHPTPFFGTYTVTASPASLLLGYSVNLSTGVITLNTSGSAPAGSYTLYITHITGCDTSATLPVTVAFGGNSAGLSTVFDTTAGGTDVYIVTTPPPSSTYAWFINGSPIANPFPPTVLALDGPGPLPGPVCVNITSGGCTTRRCATGGTHNRPASIDENISDNDPIRVFPNPNNGIFTVEISGFHTSAYARMLDAEGREVRSYKMKQGANFVQSEDLVPGNYFLLLEVDNKMTVHKIQVAR